MRLIVLGGHTHMRESAFPARQDVRCACSRRGPEGELRQGRAARKTASPLHGAQRSVNPPPHQHARHALCAPTGTAPVQRRAAICGPGMLTSYQHLHTRCAAAATDGSQPAHGSIQGACSAGVARRYGRATRCRVAARRDRTLPAPTIRHQSSGGPAGSQRQPATTPTRPAGSHPLSTECA